MHTQSGIYLVESNVVFFAADMKPPIKVEEIKNEVKIEAVEAGAASSTPAAASHGNFTTAFDAVLGRVFL